MKTLESLKELPSNVLDILESMLRQRLEAAQRLNGEPLGSTTDEIVLKLQRRLGAIDCYSSLIVEVVNAKGAK